MSPNDLLFAMFCAAVDAASASRCVPANLPERPSGRVVVVGAGKAAAEMALAVENEWHDAVSGVVVTRYGHGVPCRHVEVVEAGHPNPDAAGVAAASRIRDLVSGLTADDLVLCLWSGGGSSLLALPASTITLADKRSINQQLLRSGAGISEINCVRKHLSAIKGGRLALLAHPAQVVSLIISDVPGDDLSVIASGPTVADASTCREACEVLERYDLNVPAHVLQWLRSDAAETPKAGDERLARVRNILIATPMMSLRAAAQCASDQGIHPFILGDGLEGEARESARVHAGIARSCAEHGEPAATPCVLISGGETTVSLRGRGRGGRNAEFLLALALALKAHPQIWGLACDTDGIDGTEDNAGARITPDTLERAVGWGYDPQALLDDNDAWRLFDALGDLIVTGPTRTNVNDFRALLIERGSLAEGAGVRAVLEAPAAG
ncbi:MAG TPA: glycerate kinase [Steroidobacteraceae bacterium]|jgi:hydroxypyruvate reductase|nr:glycerate kinase [Steroidobacteraceae bacterium]